MRRLTRTQFGNALRDLLPGAQVDTNELDTVLTIARIEGSPLTEIGLDGGRVNQHLSGLIA